MASFLNWDDYKFFVAIADAGSVRAAGKTLGVNPSTVSRRLEQFESRLGFGLFKRTHRGLELTADGENILVQVRRVADELSAVEAQLKGRDPREGGVIRLEAPDALLSSFLMADLRQFAEDYPEITLNFVPSRRGADLMQREVDVAIRMTDAPPEDLVGHSLGSFAIAAYGLPDVEDWVGWTGGGPLEAISESIRLRDFPEHPARHCAGNVISLLAAVNAGLGVAALPCALGDQQSALVRLGGKPVLGPELWLLMHPQMRGAARIQRLNDCLREVFSVRVDLLRGRGTIRD